MTRTHPTGLLVSYWKWRRSSVHVDWRAHLEPFVTAGLPLPRIVVDSGVYSARRLNITLPVDRYAAWAGEQAACDGYGVGFVNMDYPLERGALNRNLHALTVALGPSQVWPVLAPVHTDADLERMCEGWPWCAVSSAGTGAETADIREAFWRKDLRESKLVFFDRVHRIAARHGTLLHALGVGAGQWALDPFDWGSADASLVSSAERYGTFLVWDSVNKRLGNPVIAINRPRSGGNPIWRKDFLDVTATMGISLRRAVTDRLYRAACSSLSMARAEAYYNHRNRHGFRFFMAEHSPKKLAAAYQIAHGIDRRTGGVT